MEENRRSGPKVLGQRTTLSSTEGSLIDEFCNQRMIELFGQSTYGILK